MTEISPKGKLVLDANIIISAIFGTRIRKILEHPDFISKITICCSAVILEEVESNVPKIACREYMDLEVFQDSLMSLKERLTVFYHEHMYKKEKAQARLPRHSSTTNDWQVVALALHLNCGIFSHDKDFWGIGVSIWSIDTVERCLEQGGLDL